MVALVEIPLTEDERRLLRYGLTEWGGPARCSDEMAVAIGFSDAADLHRQKQRLANAVDDGQPLSAQDWRRVLLATEIVFVSDVVGSGLDWSITTGLRDEETIALLRQVQRKMPRWRGSAQFTTSDDGPVTITDPDRPVPSSE